MIKSREKVLDIKDRVNTIDKRKMASTLKFVVEVVFQISRTLKEVSWELNQLSQGK